MPSQNIEHIVVENERDFDLAVTENGVVVDVDSEIDKKAYERLDSKLAELIQGLMMSELGQNNEGFLFHQNWDWWPTRTRFLYLDPLVIQWKLIDKLRLLLVGEHSDWRVNVHVIGDMSSGNSKEIGGLNIYRDWLLLQRSIYNLLLGSLGSQ